LLGVLVVGVFGALRLWEAYNIGEDAADAVMDTLGLESEEAFDIVEEGQEMPDTGSFGDTMTALLNRAGIGPDEEDMHSPEAWARRFEMSARDSEGKPEHEQFMALQSTVITNDNGSKTADGIQWGDTWMRMEINQMLEQKREELNDDMYDLVEDKMTQVPLPHKPKLEIDYFTGLETLFIDEMEVTEMHSDLDNGKAVVHLRVGMHSGTLNAGGRFRTNAKRGTKWYSFKMAVHGFNGEAKRMDAHMDWEDRKITKADVNRVNRRYSNIDATCYSKNNPNKKDGLCTMIMRKKLKGNKALMEQKLSTKVTDGLQAKIDAKVPMSMGR
jgi:hypothetical protein